jgi:hypothetical protein
MSDEGERREREDDSEDPFEKYAEELDKKYEEASESENRNVTRPGSASDQVTETDGETEESSKNAEDADSFAKREDEFPIERGENREEEFGAYAKELKEKYKEKEGDADSAQAQESGSQDDGKATTPERQVSQGQDGEAEDNLKVSAELDTRRDANSSEEKSTEVGGYQQIADNKTGDMDKQTHSSNPERPKRAPSDEPGSEIVKPKPAAVAESRAETLPKGVPSDKELSVGNQHVREKELQDDQSQRVEQKTMDAVTGTIRETRTESSRAVEGKVAEPTQVRVSEEHVDHATRQKPIENELKGVIENPKEIPVVLSGRWETRSAYVSVPKSVFQELTGTELRRGKMYEIHFGIKGVGDSWTRHSESENQVDMSSVKLHVNQSHSDRLRIGESLSVAIDYVTDKRCLRVTQTSHGPAFRIYEHYLESMGIDNPDKLHKNSVVEIGVKNLSNQESRMDKCFTTMRFGTKPSHEVCLILVKGLGGRRGDVMEVQYAKGYALGNFVRNFNEHQPKELRNVTLAMNQDKLMMKVDGNEVSLENPRLSTNKLQVCLRAELEHTERPIFFWFDGEDSRVRFLQKSLVYGMRAEDSRLDISYHQSQHNTPTFRFRTEAFEIGKFRDDLKLVSVPEYVGDSYIFRVSQSFQEHVRLRLNAATGPFDARCMKGDISEVIQRHLLSVIGQWKELEYHPFDRVWRTHECKKTGPDSVQRSSRTGDLSYFEFRWSSDPYQAYFSCRRQALDDLKKWPDYNGEPVRVAHVGTLEWDVRKTSLNFYVREASPDKRGYRAWKV